MSEDRNNKRRTAPEGPTSEAFPRHKLGRVEHDERGNARMEWALMPENATPEERVVLALLEEPDSGGGAGKPPPVARAARAAFQPYGGGTPFAPAEPEAAPRKPKDLRKLGEWLKMTRELEARRKNGERGD